MENFHNNSSQVDNFIAKDEEIENGKECLGCGEKIHEGRKYCSDCYYEMSRED